MAEGAETYEEREGLRDETRKFMAAVKARFRHMRENYRRFKKAMRVVSGWRSHGSSPGRARGGAVSERDRIADELRAEVERRDQWYGLDNWGWREVVDFVLDRAEDRPDVPGNRPDLRLRAEAERLRRDT